MKEYRIFGPPGTGKTTRLATVSIPAAVAKYGSDQVIITSFTRAAAREISIKKSRKTGQSIPVSDENVGTLHKFMFHALGCPVLATTKLKEWNDQHPGMEITGKSAVGSSLDEGGGGEAGGAGDGDRRLNRINHLRNRLVPPEAWPNDLQVFNKNWKRFKNDICAMDFTDLLEEGLNQHPIAPSNPKVIFVDEAQDFTPLQLKIIRTWGQNVDHIVLVGDDDQAIMAFQGAKPEAFLQPPIPEERMKILGQSWRVPPAVLTHAMRMIEKVRTRQHKIYQPRKPRGAEPSDFQGTVSRLSTNWKNPELLIKYVESDINAGTEIMILVSCSYMLEPIKQALRQLGVAFHNPYRKTRGDWNPLASGGEGKMSARDLLATYLDSGPDNGYWNCAQLLSLSKQLKTRGVWHSTKRKKQTIEIIEKAIKAGNPGVITVREFLKDAFTYEAFEKVMARDVDWLITNVKSNRKKALEYPIRVYNAYGDRQALVAKPLVTIGTIHSVKGGESQKVYLFPDISYAANEEWMIGGATAEDNLRRLFYVGMTRASEHLVLCDPIPAYGQNIGPHMEM
jgi:DNA helicase-2/ATP-dependent DNA helicase PcrA